jgi:hypothetical protein
LYGRQDEGCISRGQVWARSDGPCFEPVPNDSVGGCVFVGPDKDCEEGGSSWFVVVVGDKGERWLGGAAGSVEPSDAEMGFKVTTTGAGVFLATSIFGFGPAARVPFTVLVACTTGTSTEDDCSEEDVEVVSSDDMADCNWDCIVSGGSS